MRYSLPLWWCRTSLCRLFSQWALARMSEMYPFCYRKSKFKWQFHCIFLHLQVWGERWGGAGAVHKDWQKSVCSCFSSKFAPFSCTAQTVFWSGDSSRSTDEFYQVAFPFKTWSHIILASMLLNLGAKNLEALLSSPIRKQVLLLRCGAEWWPHISRPIMEMAQEVRVNWYFKWFSWQVNAVQL